MSAMQPLGGINICELQLAPPRAGHIICHLPIRLGGAEQPASSSKDAVLHSPYQFAHAVMFYTPI